MKPFHKMTQAEYIDTLRSLYYAQPNADWDTLKVGSVIMNKGQAWRITHIPPKRGFVMGNNVLTDEIEKLLRSQYDSDDLKVTDEATLAILRTVHREEIEKAVAKGKSISPLVQYDYPELFTPYPADWDENRVERAHELWRRINEMRAFNDRQGPGWQFSKVDDLMADAELDIAIWEVYRVKVEAGGLITNPASVQRALASVTETISELKERIEILVHLRTHLEKTVRSDETK